MKKLLFCTHKVNRANIKRETRDGVEHIIITSYTLPPNIVMNGGLYPTEERDKSFESLNRTPVTIEHPVINGQFVSASDPETDMNFRFGAWNENAQITGDNRISLDKVINVQKALMVPSGKRLLDRIEEIETNENARPLHTSVGVYLDVEDTELKTNDRGQEYTWIAKDMIFDHDAILLDSVGASTPDQGTGIGVNKEQINVMHYNCSKPSEKKERKVKASNFLTNELSFDQIERQLHEAVNFGNKDDEWNYIVSVFDDTFIFETQSNEMFRSNYILDEHDNLSIQDTRIPVERVVEYRTINPTETKEDSAMRDSLIAELVKLGIKVNADISDTDLKIEYDAAKLAEQEAIVANAEKDKNKNKGDTLTAEKVASIVANEVKKAVEPLQAELQANSDKELEGLAAVIVNSKKYPELDASDIKSLGIDKAKAMAANCGFSSGIGSTMIVNEDQDSDTLVTKVEDLPD